MKPRWSSLQRAIFDAGPPRMAADPPPQRRAPRCAVTAPRQFLLGGAGTAHPRCRLDRDVPRLNYSKAGETEVRLAAPAAPGDR